jgi:serine/threonine protein kinase
VPRTPAQPQDLGVRPGHVFLGKYRVEEILGQGAMGIVAKCTHLQLGGSIAIKMLRQEVLSDRDAHERFMREAKAASKLRSEYVARVTDVGTFENDVPYIVMEFLDGLDLDKLLKERGSVQAGWASELMLQAAEALAEAHSINIVHRDVKPSNLFVTWRPDGSAIVKVLDFGISKAPIDTDLSLTQTQSLLGTPAYMSPEQMRSARMVDARSDIWSLGTVFYELLENRRPFEADSFSEMCVKVAVDPPSPMVNAPEDLQEVVLRCLQKAPEHRYQSMADLGHELIPFCQNQEQARILVERMQRLLRRSGGAAEFETITSSGVRIPRDARDLKSGPIARARTPLPMPAATTSEVYEIPRRRKWPLALLAFAVIGAGVAATVTYVGTGDEAQKPAVANPAPVKEPPNQAAAVPAPEPPAPTPAPPPPAEAKAEPAVAPTPPPARAAVKPKKPSRVVAKQAPKTQPAPPPPEVKAEPAPAEPAKPKCNPWDSMRPGDCKR